MATRGGDVAYPAPAARVLRVGAITGGGSGIGAATAERLVASGFDAILIGYRASADGALATADAVRRAGGSALVAQVDVSDDASVRTFAQVCAERFGRCDAVVNSAGMTRWIPLGDLESVSDDDWVSLFDVNAIGSFRVARAFQSLLTASEGVVVNVASTAAHRGAGSSIPYAVSKAAVLHLSRMLAIAMAPAVRVVSVSPGTVDTAWHRDRLAVDALDEYYSTTITHTPGGRLTDAGDVADVIAGLIDSHAVTGIDVVVDGGKHITY